MRVPKVLLLSLNTRISGQKLAFFVIFGQMITFLVHFGAMTDQKTMGTRRLVGPLICEYQNFCSLVNKLGLGMNIAQCAFAVLVSSFAPKWPAFRFPFLLSEQSSLSMI